MKTEQGRLAGLLEHLHDFKAVWTLKVQPRGGYPDEDLPPAPPRPPRKRRKKPRKGPQRKRGSGR